MIDPEAQQSMPPATRAQALAVWSRIATEHGYGDPLECSEGPGDWPFSGADQVLGAWYLNEKEKVEAEGTPEEIFQFNLSLVTFFVDAGFHGRDYLNDVANNRLVQHELAIEALGLPDLLRTVRATRAAINQLRSKAQ